MRTLVTTLLRSRATLQIVWLLLAAIASNACSAASRDERPDAEKAVPSARLVDMPSSMLSECRTPQLRDACPTRVPHVSDVDFKRANASSQAKNLWVFFAEWNAPRPGLTAENAPPAFAHLNVYGGDLSKARAFESKSLGNRTWNGREGELFLAPPFPEGGLEGNHLIFEWRRDDAGYSISLHAWKPLAQTEATLRAVVESTHSPASD